MDNTVLAHLNLPDCEFCVLSVADCLGNIVTFRVFSDIQSKKTEGQRILLESSAERNIDIADFCDSSMEIEQYNTAKTINIHCLRYLHHQCWSFGPLFLIWAMSFESAKRVFNRSFTSTHSDCQVFCRRYLEQRSLVVALSGYALGLFPGVTVLFRAEVRGDFGSLSHRRCVPAARIVIYATTLDLLFSLNKSFSYYHAARLLQTPLPRSQKLKS